MTKSDQIVENNWTGNNYTARLIRIERMLILVLKALSIMEKEMNIDFTATTAALEKLKGAEATTKKLVEDMNAKIAELSASISNPEDQAKVDAFAAAFAAEADNFPKAAAADPGANAAG